MNKKKKIIIITLWIVLSLRLGYLFFEDICQNDPECACKDVAPGDPTCMSVEGLDKWCDEQPNQESLPQCNL
ncbi:MAG: hypothetical protein HOO06_13975 [Bdellovibrionaceae bacterium]|jgi:hypothetical protein|nr:hypothetical protein [Pseudobdellovibrionaceae bacterium]